MDRRQILKNILAAPLLGLSGLKQGVGGYARLKPMRAAALGSIGQQSMATLAVADGDTARRALDGVAASFSDSAARMGDVAARLREASLTTISLPAIAPPPASIFHVGDPPTYEGDEAFHLVLHLDPRRSPFAAVPPPLPAVRPPGRASPLDQAAAAHQVS